MEVVMPAPKTARAIVAALGALLILTFLLLFLIGSRTQAAPLYQAGTDTNPRIQAITATADLPIFDTYPGGGITKAIYFNDSDTPGVLTLTFEISGTPVLTLTAGAAFEDPVRTYTSANTPWSPVVTYSVETGGGDYPGVGYTAVNTNGLRTTVIITYVRDVTGPTVLSPSIVETSNYIYTVGPVLYYTNTMELAQTFAVRGHSDDAAGVERVRFSPAFGDSLADDISGFYPWLSQAYTIEPGETGIGAITATVYDRLGNTTTQTYPYELDGTPPTVTVNAPAVWHGLNPIPVAWQAWDTQSGVARTRLYYRRVPTDTLWQDSGLEQAGPSGTFHFTSTGYLTHTFAARTTDNLGHTSALPATGPQTIVEIARIHLPLVVKVWVWWYQYDIYEPNDSPAQAYGPLTSGQAYEAYIWDTTDQNDYYHFTPETAGTVQTTLTQIPTSGDYDLYVYYYDGQYRQVAYSNRSGSVSEDVTFMSIAGRKYYIRVFRYSGFSSQQPYHLTAIYH